MEAQLKELIDKIKSEGVAEAEEKAKQIEEEAQQQASAVVAEAQKKAEQIVSEAKENAERFEQTGKKALQQAGRDLVLNLKASITGLFESVVTREIKESLTPDALEKMITHIIKAWQKEGIKGIEVLLSPEDLKKLEKGLMNKLSAEMKKGVELKPIPEIQAGFRIGEKDGSAYYDFTDKGIAEHLAQHLSPKLAECLK